MRSAGMGRLAAERRSDRRSWRADPRAGAASPFPRAKLDTLALSPGERRVTSGAENRRRRRVPRVSRIRRVARGRGPRPRVVAPLQPGRTNRANSVWPNHLEGPCRSTSESAASRRTPSAACALFQLTAAARPTDLDDALARRGYEILPTEVWTAPTALEVPASPAIRAVSIDFDDVWWRLSGERGARGAEIPVSPPRRARAAARASPSPGHRRRPGATGIGVLGADRVGVFAMRTLERLRGRGFLGRAILAEIALRPRARRRRTLPPGRATTEPRGPMPTAGFRPVRLPLPLETFA
jgi:hypothetical protein